MNMPLVLLNRRRRGFTAFSPSTLFALAEPGVWFDPSDLTTLFQDPAGTTPVTTPGQTVGLMLDKSKGGQQTLPTTGWTVNSGDGVVTIVDNVITITGATITTRVDVTSPGWVVGDYAKITVNSSIGSATGAAVWLGAVYNVSAGVATYANFLSGSTLLRLQINSGTATFTVTARSRVPGSHATQATLASRPTYQVDGNGKAYLAFDGVDDGMVTGTITPGVDKAQIFAGVRKLSDVRGVLYELSAGIASNNGSLTSLPSYDGSVGNAATWWVGSKGTALSSASTDTSFSAPQTVVQSQIADIAADNLTLRINGTQITQATTDQGTGNFLAYPLYIGRRGGTALPYNGRIYSLITRFGANLDAGVITNTETWVAGKTGIVI